jgi:crossover junction endodeoxyribonuclease RusA
MMDDASLSFTIVGNPVSKGSFSRMPNGAMLPAGTANSRKRFGEWRIDVRDAALKVMGERNPSDKAIRLLVEFALPYPTSSVRKYQLGWLPCVKKPDIDKLLRGLMDPMSKIVWKDDSQVIYVIVNKVYAWEGTTGARVTVDFLDEEFMRRAGENRNILLRTMANHGIH